MTFMLGAFTNGLASGAKNAMDLYGEYEGIKSKKELSDSLTNAMKSGSGSNSPAAGAVNTGGSFLGGAQSDSAASNPNPPDLNADPRKPKAALMTAGQGLATGGEHSNNRDTTTGPAPQSPGISPNAASDSAASAPAQPDQAIQTTPDSMPVPPSAQPSAAQANSRAPFGASISDWITGRNPQNRAVHLTPQMGIQTGPGPSSTPMSTSPGGGPQYLPAQNQPGQAAPQPGQAAPIGVRPPMISGMQAPGAPTLANQQQPAGQAIQMQNGGF